MPIRGARPRRVVPGGLSDAIDGTAAQPDAMAMLGNLIPLPSSRAVMVPRPGMDQFIDVGGGPISAIEAVGDLIYGMYANPAFPGRDAPFILNTVGATKSFIPPHGLSSGLLPQTQPLTGDWTPPTIAQVGGRIVFTHPGFPGGPSMPTNVQEFLGTTISGKSELRVGVGVSSTLTPGTVLYGSPLISPGTTVQSIFRTTVTQTGTGLANATFFSVTDATGIYPGQTAQNSGVNAIVTSVSGTTVNINTPTVAGFTSQTVTFAGQTVEMSANALNTGSGLFTAVSTMAIKFGWLDIGSFSTTLEGNTLPYGTPAITGFFDTTGIQPGQTVTGPGINPGTTVSQAANISFVVNCTLINGSNLIKPLAALPASSLAIGQFVSGAGIPSNTTIIGIDLTNQVIALSNAATADQHVASLTVSGAILVLSDNTTAAANNQQFSIAGGTPAAPLWGAGDLNVNPIAGAAPPVFVANFANRAYYGVNTPTTAGVQASDAGSPCTQSFANQTLLFTSGVPVTAAAGLPLFNQLGGIIQSLMVFQGDTNINQISGDFSTNDIAVNTLPVATGTLAPNSIAASPRGLLFAATDGLRMIDFNAAVSDPIGEHGQGLVVPFIDAVTPSRMAGAFNENVYRLTITWQPPPEVFSVWGQTLRTDEFWFHLADLGQPLERSRWTGPHTSTCAFAAPFPAKSSFLVEPLADRGKLYRSDPKQTARTVYAEFGRQLVCSYQTLLLPDNPDGFMHVTTETTIWLGLISGTQEVLVTATDDFAQVLDQAYVYNSALTGPMQRVIMWHYPLNFRQMRVSFTMLAAAQVEIGTLVMRTKELGYQLPYPVPDALILGQGVLGGSDAIGP